MPHDPRPRVAIACQGGGSHTAFTAGVLGRLFRDDVLSRYKVVGLSGTSGGAICAMLAWSALIGPDATQADSLLRKFWADNSASSWPDRTMNAWMMWAARSTPFMATPEFSPYDIPTSGLAKDQFRGLLTQNADFDSFARVAGDADAPRLFLGAVDVLSGEFKAFDSLAGEITPDAVLASAAIPTLFTAVHEAGGAYWDGLFSQNPPIRELLATQPDELWVIQINPKELVEEPRTIREITDRRNELSGNLSLYQELGFIEQIDSMIEDGTLAPGKFKLTTIRVIEKVRSTRSRRLQSISKLNRDPAFLEDLIARGLSRAEEFIGALAFESAWLERDLDRLMSQVSDDATFSSAEPFTEQEATGADGLRAFLDRALEREFTLDLTHKQVAGDVVTWRIRLPGEGDRPRDGQARVVVSDGKIVNLHLGSSA